MLYVICVGLQSLKTLIHMMIRQNQVKPFKILLKEGLIYLIKKFKIVNATVEYKPGHHALKIVFLLTTIVKKANANIEKNEESQYMVLRNYLLYSVRRKNTRINISIEAIIKYIAI